MRTMALATIALIAGCAASPARKPDFELNGLKVRVIGNHDYYPPALRRQNIGGRVSLNYSVSAQGIPERIAVLVSDNEAFEAGAEQLLKDWRFEVPANWAGGGGEWRRFRLQVTFVIEGTQPLPPLDEGPNVTVTGSRVHR